APGIQEELLEGAAVQLELIRAIEGQHAAEEDGQPEDARRRGAEGVGVGAEGEAEEEKDHPCEEDDGVEVRLRAPFGGQILPGECGGPGEFRAPAHRTALFGSAWPATIAPVAAK